MVIAVLLAGVAAALLGVTVGWWLLVTGLVVAVTAWTVLALVWVEARHG